MLGAREGELPPSDSRALEGHLETCDRCRAIARDFAATEGMVEEALLARANSRDFSTFADEVMARVGRAERRGFFGWLGRHRAATAAALVPVMAALALLVYVRVGGGPEPIAMMELSSEGAATTVLETADGPVVLLADEDNGS
jgi:anti-sigma factor RsiW